MELEPRVDELIFSLFTSNTMEHTQYADESCDSVFTWQYEFVERHKKATTKDTVKPNKALNQVTTYSRLKRKQGKWYSTDTQL